MSATGGLLGSDRRRAPRRSWRPVLLACIAVLSLALFVGFLFVWRLRSGVARRPASDRDARLVHAATARAAAAAATGGFRAALAAASEVRGGAANTNTPLGRVVVTGGAGFVGSHLVDVLVKRGHAITVVDDFSTGRRRNIAHWLGAPGFALLEADVASFAARGAPLDARLEGAEAVYHLACPASPPRYSRDMSRTLRTAIEGTRAALELAAATGARLLLASTSEVYGDPEEHPQAESYRGAVNAMGPRASYDEGKRAGEALAYAYARQR